MDRIGNNQRDALLTRLLSVANIVPEGCIAAFATNQKKLLLRLTKQSLAALSVQRAAYCPRPTAPPCSLEVLLQPTDIGNPGLSRFDCEVVQRFVIWIWPLEKLIINWVFV